MCVRACNSINATKGLRIYVGGVTWLPRAGAFPAAPPCPSGLVNMGFGAFFPGADHDFAYSDCPPLKRNCSEENRLLLVPLVINSHDVVVVIVNLSSLAF